MGDQLRAIYDNLARDPNSLANLDQDLPNYAQHSVPIHSLPQEWLWCESWCSDGSKAQVQPLPRCCYYSCLGIYFAASFSTMILHFSCHNVMLCRLSLIH